MNVVPFVDLCMTGSDDTQTERQDGRVLLYVFSRVRGMGRLEVVDLILMV